MPLVVFALPNEKEERNDFEVAIPKLGSVILTHSLDGTFDPLTSVPASERPPVTAGVLRLPHHGRAGSR